MAMDQNETASERKSLKKQLQNNTLALLEERIQRRTEARLARIGEDPALIDARLQALDREWDIDRAIEAQVAAVSMFGFVLGLTRRGRRLFGLPTIAATFLLQKTLQGWSNSPVVTFRRLGFRTTQEIEKERLVLKSRRGDFEHLRWRQATHEPSLRTDH